MKKVLRNNKANKLFHKDEFIKAKDLYQKNSIEHPDDASSLYNLGDAYYKNKQYDKALSEYQNALKDEKINKSWVWNNVGNSYFKKKN